MNSKPTNPEDSLESRHSQIIKLLLQRDKLGFEKYGTTLHSPDAKPPTGSWQTEILEELLDALQYSAKLIAVLEAKVNYLQNL